MQNKLVLFRTCLLVIILNICVAFALPLQSSEEHLACNTNAECLKRGLPLLNPSRTRVRRDTVPEPSSFPETYIYPFRILLSTTDGGPVYRYWSGVQNSGGELNQMVTPSNIDQALILYTNVPPGSDSATEINFKLKQPPSAGYQWFGFWPRYAQNNGNFNPSGTSSFGYYYPGSLITTKESKPEAVNVWTTSTTKATYYESAVFNLDTTTNAITTTWVNADPTVYGPTTPLKYVTGNDLIYGISDPKAWGSFTQLYLRMERVN